MIKIAALVLQWILPLGMPTYSFVNTVDFEQKEAGGWGYVGSPTRVEEVEIERFH